MMHCLLRVTGLSLFQDIVHLISAHKPHPPITLAKAHPHNVSHLSGSYTNFVTASYGKYKPQGTATIEFDTDAWKFRP